MQTIKKLNNRYNFIQQLSERKGATVFLGYDEVTGVKVIIKRISKTRSKKENDFSILRRLRHPGLPEINDAFEMNGAMYIIMEYLEGSNLRELICSGGILEEEKALEIILDVLEVLDYLYSMKPHPLVHGDIKPENIIISNGRAVLIDFGSTDNEEASSGFCAPERFAGIAKSIESDLYAVGELLHYLLSGDIKKVYNRKKSVVLSNDIYRIIDKSTKKLPGERYHKAAGMASQIKRIIELRKAGIDSENTIRTICVPGCSEAAVEMAYAISGLKQNVLIVDLDMLSPSVHTILGVDKFSYCLQDFLSGNPMDLKTKCTSVKRSNLKLLPCRTDYENYESVVENCIPILISGASGFFDIIIMACSDFPYDKFFMDSLLYCDIVIFPIVKGVIDIRKYNSMVRFMSERQNILKDKIFFMGMNINESNINSIIAAGAVETSWIGSIPHSPARASLYESGNPYIFSMKKKIFNRCIRILRKTGVLE